MASAYASLPMRSSIVATRMHGDVAATLDECLQLQSSQVKTVDGDSLGAQRVQLPISQITEQTLLRRYNVPPNGVGMFTDFLSAVGIIVGNN